MECKYYVVSFYEGCSCVHRDLAYSPEEAELLAASSRGYDAQHDVNRNAYIDEFPDRASAIERL